MAKEKKTFKVGDMVQWTSHANGGRATKVGKVIKVVPEGRAPAKVDRAKYDGRPRKGESYLVEVGGFVYHPRVNYLEAQKAHQLTLREFVRQLVKHVDKFEAREKARMEKHPEWYEGKGPEAYRNEFSMWFESFMMFDEEKDDDER